MKPSSRRIRRSLLAAAAAFSLVPSPSASQSAPPASGAPSLAPGLSAFAAALVVRDGEIFVGRPGGVSMFPMPPNRPGGVHVFARAGDSWSEAAALGPEGGEIGTGFGQALDASGDVMVVGAPDDGPGAIYLYRRDGDGWTPEGRVTWSEAQPAARFGAAVATDGTVVFAGAPGQAEGAGAVVVLERVEGTWRTTAALTADVEPEASFGSSLDVDRGMLAVGAPGGGLSMIPGTPQPRLIPGSAHLFQRGSAGWEERARLEPPLAGPASLGWSVAVSGADVYASAPLAEGFSGAVYRFTAAGGDWSVSETVRPDSPVTQSGFGMSLKVSGGEMLVGAPLSGGGVGGAYGFRQGPGGDWSEVAQLGPGGPFNFYGMAVAVEGDVAVVGAPGDDLFEGTGFLFRRTADGWEEAGSIIDEAAGPDPILGEDVDCEEGRARGFGCSEVDLVAFVPVKALGAERGVIANDLWGWTDPLTGREYAIVGRTDATTFVDLGDPNNPVFLGELPLTEGAVPNMWRDIKVYENHAFIVSDGAGPHGVQVFDLTQLRDVTAPPVTFEETAHYDRIFSAHNIVINEETGFAYVVGASGGGETCGGGLHMIDVRDPVNPTFAGCFADAATGNAGTGYSHDAQCIRYHGPDEAYQGHEICFGANENALSISDVTDKDEPVAVSTASYPNTGYLHQGWVTDDHRYFFMNDEADELAGSVSRTRTLVWDIEDLEDPVLAKEHFGTTGSSDHNLYVRGDFMYQANYVSGLRILDITNPEDPQEVGFFDTVPAGDDVPGFAGAWSTYPFFESGLIIVSSMREGLFILKKRPPRVS